MDHFDPFQDFEDNFPSATATFGIEGIRLEDLQQNGAELEIYPDNFAAGSEEEEEEKDSTKKPDDGFKTDEIWRHINSDCIVPADANSDMTPFNYLETQMEDLTGEGGVFKKTIRTGTGPVIPERATVKIHYNGYLEYSDEPYDSSYLRNKPLVIHLGKGEVIPGLEIGVATMRKFEIARILVKPNYAFGTMGCPPRIPMEATLLYEVEVLSVFDSKASDNFRSMPEEEQVKLTLKELVDVATSEREKGNEYFQQKIYGRAMQCYRKGINVLESARLKDDEEEKLWSDCLLKLHLNICLCSLQQKKPKLAISHARMVLELDQNNIKATFRLGKAFVMLGEWSKAKQYLIKAAVMAPRNTEIRQELADLDRKMKRFEVIEKGIYSRMFQNTAVPSTTASNPDKKMTVNLPKEVQISLKQKLESFQNNSEMKELVLPLGASHEEMEYIEETAQLMEMTTERGDTKSSYSIKIIKPDLPDIEDFC